MATCTGKDLVSAAKCLCLSKKVLRQVMVYLACQWLKKKEPEPPVLNAPVATDATNLAATSFSANWNGVVGATGYRLDVATDAGFTTFVPGFNNLDVGLALTSLVIGVTAGTDYFYRVRAYNGVTTSANSNVIFPVWVNWGPNTAVATWIDSGGPNSGNLAFFNANADYPSVAIFTLSSAALVGITGLFNLPSLAVLQVQDNGITSLDLHGLLNLGTVQCQNNALGTAGGILNLGGCVSLVNLNASNNQLTDAGLLFNNGALQTFDCNTNFLTSLNVSGNPGLTTLNCSTNQLGNLNITGDFAITTLDFSNNPAVVIIGP